MRSSIQTENIQRANVQQTCTYKMVFCLFKFCLISNYLDSRGVFRTQSNIENGSFSENSGFQLLNIFASQMFENFSEYFRFFKFIQFVLPHKQGKLIITRKKNKNGTFNSLQKYKEKSREHPRQKQPPEVFFKKRCS